MSESGGPGIVTTYSVLAGSATIYVSGTQACADGSTGNICYAPQGAIANLTLHNGVRESWGFNTLQQPNSLAVTNAGGTPLMTLGWNYNPGTDNGNVAQQTIQRSSGLSSAGTVLTQNFSYVDPANRLSLAKEVGGWQQTYHYDAFGNRAVDPGSYIPSPGFTPQSLSEFNTKNQWVEAASYDKAGNQQALTGQSSPYLAIAGNFQYDGENRLIAANLNAGTVNYVYDGEGRRVEKIVGSGPTAGTTTYVYDATGNLAAEYTTAANPATGTEYLSADHLGSTRLVTNASGNPLSCTDYLPFGEEIPPGINGRTGCYTLEAYPGPADVTDHKFTGKERDSETGLDYFGARYFSSAQGRFTTPDEFKGGIVDPFTGQDIETNTALPYADITDPQTLNKYAYVRNNPLRYVDPTGHAPSDLVYDGQTHTLTLYSDSGDEIGSWHANNNVDSRASLGKLPDGVYPVLDQNSPHMHGKAVDAHDSNLQDSKNGEYGPGGIFRVENFVGPDGKTHTGVGVHAGREDKPDARGRTGADHATQGCIRTCDAAVKTITDTAKKDPLNTVTVQNNRKPTPPPAAPPKKKEDPR